MSYYSVTGQNCVAAIATGPVGTDYQQGMQDQLVPSSGKVRCDTGVYVFKMCLQLCESSSCRISECVLVFKMCIFEGKKHPHYLTSAT